MLLYIFQARDCQEQEERCYRCNDTGHKSRDCDRQKDEISCYNCKVRNSPLKSPLEHN